MYLVFPTQTMTSQCLMLRPALLNASSSIRSNLEKSPQTVATNRPCTLLVWKGVCISTSVCTPSYSLPIHNDFTSLSTKINQILTRAMRKNISSTLCSHPTSLSSLCFVSCFFFFFQYNTSAQCQELHYLGHNQHFARGLQWKFLKAFKKPLIHQDRAKSIHLLCNLNTWPGNTDGFRIHCFSLTGLYNFLAYILLVLYWANIISKTSLLCITNPIC